MSARSTLLAFNTVERLLRGDFFHCVTVADVRTSLAEFPPNWPLVGLGTTNWRGRHGELIVDGDAGAPRFLWADPDAAPGASIVALDSRAPVARGDLLASVDISVDDTVPRFPFAAVAVCDPLGPHERWTLGDGEDALDAVATRCRDSNIGLAALRVSGDMRDVDYQVMCHIPIGGIADDRLPIARKERRIGASWMADGIFAANPTIQSVVSDGVASVHLHARTTSDGVDGGHVNRAVAGGRTVVDLWPLYELVIRIRDLDVAQQPTRPV